MGKHKKRDSSDSSSDSDSGPEDRNDPPPKKSKSSKSSKGQRNSQGETFFDIGNHKRLTVRSFRGKTLVDIREFYEKDGDMLPGKKGISLNPSQWKKILEYASEVEDLLTER